MQVLVISAKPALNQQQGVWHMHYLACQEIRIIFNGFTIKVDSKGEFFAAEYGWEMEKIYNN